MNAFLLDNKFKFFYNKFGIGNLFNQVPERGEKMIKPLHDYVALTLEKEENKTASGIILTTESKEKQSIGKVLAIGPDVKDIALNDRVIYQSYAGTKVTIEDTDYLLIKSESILAKL